MRVLLVEDEPEMASALSTALKGHDMVVDRVATVGMAREAILTNSYGAILLDRQLPDGDGLALIPNLRAHGIQTPIIVLTARGDLADRIAGLDTGADDYLGKPFAIEELLARLRAVLRRRSDMPTETLQLGRLTYNADHREASIGGIVLALPRRELLVLETLMRRSGRTVARSTLEEAVYGFDDEIQSNALDTHVSRLRRKLAENDAGVEIHAIRGLGYLIKRTS
ncbi:response regulator transcription factor [Rhodopseudomonas boonkerdii]|uniref:response regulator transcription factor n=1 Tax=Rhodopseudomonas boonkerdii TaxID=475937 RepID=UPI001E3435D6|nr:response regulator transcription factor [Rhodopseudomonas boonkerdii]UGV26761.1 response regulator transcription factor [Rhodopseudomonas boonkerdii]